MVHLASQSNMICDQFVILMLQDSTIVDDVLKLREPIRGVDGTLMSEIHVPKGTTIVPAYLICNTDKTVWGEDALEWKPERWLTPLPAKVHEARIPSIYSNLCASHSC